jgi:tetratricopeptide (TPR) repeat protein
MLCPSVFTSDTTHHQDVSIEDRGAKRGLRGAFLGRVMGVGLLALVAIAPLLSQQAAVKVTEEQVTIPTYLVGPPNPNPQFYLGGASQGAQHRIYPYPAYDNLTTNKVAKTYTMVYLENEYVKIGVLPEIGGKIFEAIDKTNGYDFVYHQHVIKPTLISLLGAWISGGIEWDIPHHHRATSFLPAQYKVEENPDGSKTVWVGELELRDRMRWAVGITLHPGKSYVEAKYRMINRTPLTTTMLSWSNMAVAANDNYQIIFPPSTQFAVFHKKVSFTTWPIATTDYAGIDFSSGVDVSWYKNHQRGTSMFAWNYQDDFFAGYDHGKHAGVMSVTDHNYAPGKKFFTWGNSPAGRAEDTLLTDSDGSYIELMTGAYSDNQPDYSWMAPEETRSWTQYWYPFRDIDGVKNANIDAAVNLEVKDGQIHLGFYSTSDRPAAEVTLRLKDQVLLHEQIAISPAKPWIKEIALPAGADEHDVQATLSDGGKELVRYSPVRLEKKPLPPPVVDPYPAPEKLATTEELYLTGLRAEQFHSPTSNALDYWQEALKRDPGDVRVNAAMGIDCVRAGRYQEAEIYLRKALERAAKDYTNPKDGEPFYYLGLALKAQGKTDDAFNAFAKATWSYAWHSPGYLEMAKLAAMRGDYDRALGYADLSLDANTENIPALALRAALLRHTGHNEQARADIAAMKKIDPLNVRPATEEWLGSKSEGAAKWLSATFNAFPNTGLEAAADYMNAGLWQDGTDVLTLMVDSASDKAKISPLVYYDLGYFARQMQQPDKAKAYDQLAEKAPTEFVFPFQMEMIAVLEDAMQANPQDSHAPYFLGNQLYDWQPQRAVALWEKSASLGAAFPVVYRNLAMAYGHEGNQRDKQQAALENAVKFGGNAAVFNELDKLYEEEGAAPQKRLAALESHQSVLDRDDVIAREINLDIFAGKDDAAITLLESRFFRAWEGGGRYSLDDSWINAHLTLGHQHMLAKQYAQALADYQAALEPPSNLQEALGYGTAGVGVNKASGREAEIDYWMGDAYKAMGNAEKASQYWRDASTATPKPEIVEARNGAASQFSGRAAMGGQASGAHVDHAYLYYEAVALEKLGDAASAKPLFQQLMDEGAQELKNANGAQASAGTVVSAGDRTKTADAHYLIGLGQLGLNHSNEARQEFRSALEASPDHFATESTQAEMKP